MAVNAALTASFKKAALDIFNAMVTGEGEYYAEKDEYDPVTGAKIEGTDHPVRMARVKFNTEEMSTLGLGIGTVKFIFLQDELAVAPVATSGKINYDSIEYQINYVDKDPADVLWIVGAKRV